MSDRQRPQWLEYSLRPLADDIGTQMVAEGIVNLTDQLSPWPQYILVDRAARTVHEFRPEREPLPPAEDSAATMRCSFRWELAKLQVGATPGPAPYAAALRQMAQQHESTCSACAAQQEADRRIESDDTAKIQASERMGA